MPVIAKASVRSVLASSSAVTERLVVDIVLDHHLDALLQVPEADGEKEDRHHRVERVAVDLRAPAPKLPPSACGEGKDEDDASAAPARPRSAAGSTSGRRRAPAVPRPWTRCRSVRNCIAASLRSR